MPSCQETAGEVMEGEFPRKPGICAGFGISWDVLRRDIGGASRDRTDDLFHAMEALSQLSYGPTRSRGKLRTPLRIVKPDRTFM
jgi:hypothetical protein